MSLTLRLAALLLGCLLDLLFGDPHWMPHPVRAMGGITALLERPLRFLFPKGPKGELAAGAALVVLAAGISTGAAVLALWLCRRIHPLLAFAAETLLCYQLLAARSLRDESLKVYRAPAGRRPGGGPAGGLHDCGPGHRPAGPGRGGPGGGGDGGGERLRRGGGPPAVPGHWRGPLGVFYKAVNTMDSMVGYKNDRYLYFGRAAARLDDAVNFLPAGWRGC